MGKLSKFELKLSLSQLVVESLRGVGNWEEALGLLLFHG